MCILYMLQASDRYIMGIYFNIHNLHKSETYKLLDKLVITNQYNIPIGYRQIGNKV